MLILGVGNFGLADMLQQAGRQSTDYATPELAAAAAVPTLPIGQKGQLVTVTADGKTNLYFKPDQGQLALLSQNAMRPVTLKGLSNAVATDKVKVFDTPIPVKPTAEPLVTLVYSQLLGGLDAPLYWSGDGGVTARAATDGQFIPNAGDFLYANRSALGFDVLDDTPLTILYFTNF